MAWYADHARTPPWGAHPSPYTIWVAVVMLQQTRLETVIPYFERWMQCFPNISTLAHASLQEALSAWEGLGYYGRARNLHRAAQMILDEYHGELPPETKLLFKLPGIGRYTAGAIASIAFGRDEPTLDGNIRRVLARHFNLEENVHTRHAEQALWKLAAEHLPAGRAGLYNQALMDLGALLCTPKAPECEQCPVADTCQAKLLGIQEQRPVQPLRPAVPHHIVTAAVIQRGERLLITRRPTHGLLGGLWEFPGGKQQADEDLPTCLKREICEELDVEIQVGEPVGVYKHAYTHFRVTLHAFHCRLVAGEPRPIEVEQVAWVRPEDLSSYPMGKIDRQISNSLVSSESL